MLQIVTDQTPAGGAGGGGGAQGGAVLRGGAGSKAFTRKAQIRQPALFSAPRPKTRCRHSRKGSALCPTAPSSPSGWGLICNW
ncbi:MAG: hypothetical protein FWF88_05725 [Peptococcaceae bacterium]|nr:hypothetical protein [Peptococcaceae bacterium]